MPESAEDVAQPTPGSSSSTGGASSSSNSALTSFEVNTLLYSYLSETGLAHTAYAIKHESGLDNAVSAHGTRLLDCHVPQNHLIRLLHKGLLYLEAEARWRGDDVDQNPPRLLGYDIQDHLPIKRIIQHKNIPEAEPSEPFRAPAPPPPTASSSSRPESSLPNVPEKDPSPPASHPLYESRMLSATHVDKESALPTANGHSSTELPPETAMPAPPRQNTSKRRSSTGAGLNKSPKRSASQLADGAPSGHAVATPTDQKEHSPSHSTSSLQLNLPPLPKRSSSSSHQHESALKRKERDASDDFNRSTDAMDVDQAPVSASKDAAAAANDSHLESNSNRAKPPPADSASPQDQPSSSFKESRDSKRPKLDPESLPPPALPPFKQDSALPPPTPNSSSISSAPATSTASLKSPAASTPSTSSGPKPFPVVTVRTIATPKPPGPPQREPSAGSLQQHHQQSQHASQSALGHSTSANGRPNSSQGRPRSISPNVSTKQPHKDSSKASVAPAPGSASSSRGGSPEAARKTPGSNGGSALPHTSGSKKNAAPFSASNHKSRDAADKSRDNSPALAIKAEQAAALAAEPLRKGRGKSPARGTIDNDDCVVLKGHSAQVTPCSWNPKVPSMVATGAYDGTARIWDVPDVSGSPSGRVVDESVVAKHGSKNKRIEVGVVAWNPDGTLLATGCADGICRVWTPIGDLYLVLSMHQRGINSIKWNRTGTMVLTASMDASVICWELSSGRARLHFETHTESVMECDWYDDLHFATCSVDRAIHLGHINRSSPLHRLRGHQDEVNACRFDPTKTVLASCSDDKTVRIWSMKGLLPRSSSSSGSPSAALDDAGGVFVLQGHHSDVHNFAWDPMSGVDGRPRVLASASFDHTARVWDADQGTCLYVLDRSIDLVYSVSFSPLDGEFLALGSNDRRMCVYRKNGELMYEYKHGGAVYEVQWHPSKLQLAVMGESLDVGIVPLRLENQQLGSVEEEKKPS